MHTTNDRSRSDFEVIEHYIAGAVSGDSSDMRPAFFLDTHATVFGYVGEDLFAGPIEHLYHWNDENGPASELQARIGNIDIAGSVATVRLELENWTGYRFTDLFTMLRVDGQWKIMNRVFHLHAEQATPD